jgi:LruC domain-containing protein
MRKLVLSAALLGVIILPSCKKSDSTSTKPVINSINDIKVPAGFNWASSHNVDFTAAITDTRFSTAIHVISIYDGDPFNGGNLIAKGTATTATPYLNKLYVASQLKQLYVVKTSPDNSRIINTIDVTGTTASTSFGAIDPNALGKRENGFKTTTVDCNSGCTNTITSNTNNLNVNSGDVICITGSNITVSFSNVSGGTIRVCGSNVTLQNLGFNGAATLLITSSGSANVSGINYNSSSAYIENDGVLNGTFADNGIFTNNGTFNSSGDFNINSNAGVFINNGTINISGNFQNGSPSTTTNNGTMNISGSFQQNSSGPGFVNNCTLIVTGNYNQSNRVKNYNLIKVNGTTTINSSTQLSLYNGAMLQTVNFILDGSTIKGYGSTSLVKITGSVAIQNSDAVLTGALQVASNNTISGTYLTSGAATGNTLYIPTSPCNSIGNGAPVVVDADGDGVPDNLDAYPNDASRAYDNYYPSISGMATAAFEDQWPSKGDFDLNDLVISYRYDVVTNATNNVAQVTGTYSLLASGGSLPNAFSIQFPVTRTSVSGLTGTGTLEPGQSKAVIILFTNMRNEMAQWNTVPGIVQTPARSYAFTFNVAGGPSISTFGLNGYNPFIWSSGTATSRGEIHLWGHAPTDLANTALFGTADDNTSVANGSYYLTKTGLPYAIEIPVTPFSYPNEGVDITKAYLNFGTWAQSSGGSLTDWYTNIATGYRNSANIYTR